MNKSKWKNLWRAYRCMRRFCTYRQIIFLITALCFTALHCIAQQIDVEKLADCVYVAEGGPKASIPYGILSVRVHSASEARAVCVRTIRHDITRWRKAGAKGSMIEAIAATYCPASCDPVGNRNWVRNVTWLFNRKMKGKL